MTEEDLVDELELPAYDINMRGAIRRFYVKYATFRGRAGRREFWLAVLFFWLVVVGTYAVIYASNGARGFGSGNRAGMGFGLLIGVFLLVFYLGSLLPALALLVRRLHDANLPGTYAFLWLVPYVGGFILLGLAMAPTHPDGVRYDPPQPTPLPDVEDDQLSLDK